MIYDPRHGAFALPAGRGNRSIGMRALIDPETFRPCPRDPFRLTGPVDLERAARRETELAIAGLTPCARPEKKPKLPQRKPAPRASLPKATGLAMH